MNKETTSLLFYSNESGASPQMFPFYSKTQFRSIDSANRSREIYRENEVKLFAVFTFVGENERDRLMSAATFSSRARKIHDYTRFKNDRQFIFLLFCSVSRRLAILSPLLLARRFRLYEESLISDAMRLFNALKLLETLWTGLWSGAQFFI